ncbi:MAG: ABC transporter substrate-binding protein [Candidatus Tectomicrobia bacterium]|nr:ABC transporter substrate-binding protein [Candidatus Tectomicrobia bacterium]
MERFLRQVSSLALPGLLVLGLLVGTTGGAALAADLKIGAIIPISGPVAAYGKGQELAMRLAVDEVNAAGGVRGMKLQPILIDNHSKKEEAIIATKRLIERDKVLLIWGPFTSGDAENAFPVANRAGVPIVSASSAKPGVAAANRPWTFRVSLTTDKLYSGLVKRWVETFKIKKVVILYDSQEAVMQATATKVFPALLKNSGAEVMEQITFGSADIDYSAQITKVKAMKPDGLIINAIHTGGALISKEMAKQGLTIPTIGGVGHDARYLELAGQAGAGLWTAQGFWPDHPNPKVGDFVRRFKERSEGGLAPNQEMASLYDTVFITAKILTEQGVTNDPAKLTEDREKIRRGFETLKDFPGVTGTITMTPSGDTFKTATMLEARGGAFRIIE